MVTSIRYTVLVFLFILQIAVAQEGKEPINLLIRCDDIGMNHAVNEATKELLESGLTISTSVIFSFPFYH